MLLLTALIVVHTTVTIPPTLPGALREQFIYVGGGMIPWAFPFANYNDNCYGFVSAACDAYENGLDPMSTKPAVSKSWIEKRQKSEIWLKLDQVAREIRFDAEDIAYEIKYISPKLVKHEMVPLVLLGRNRHAVVAYALLRGASSNDLYILVYDPDKRDDGSTYGIDYSDHRGEMGEPTIQRGDRVKGFKGPYLKVNSGMNRFLGYVYYDSGAVADNFDRFMTVRNFKPLKPINFSSWEKAGEG